MKIAIATISAVLLSAGFASAQVDTEALIADLQAQGFTRIEARNGPTQVKVEAIRGTQKVEAIYDRETGALLKEETETVRPGEDTAPGISVRTRNRDFVDDRRVASSDDDGSSDRGRRGRGADDSRDSDDRLGGDDDDDRDDDNSGSEDNGNDGSDDNDGNDDNGDDNGGDDGGRDGDDDHGSDD